MRKTRIPAPENRRSACPIANALDLVGDRWTLLIVRDIALFDKHRNKDFQEAGEAIPSNILANRLRRLVEAGLVEKRPYQDNPPRYEYHLTDAGRRLEPVLRSLARWSRETITGVEMPQELR